MRKNLGPFTYLYPLPVLIIGTYDENGKPDAMNAAWGGISDFKQVSIALSLEHKTVKNLLNTKAFTISIADEKHVVEADYFGVVSGNKEPNKIEKANMHTEKSEFVNAPIILEFPMTLECKMLEFNEETGILKGEIVNISVDEKIIGSDGKVDPSLFNPITYDPVNNTYIKLGEVVGKAFSDGLKIK